MITLNKKDWARLQWSVALFVVLSAAGATIVSLSIKAQNDAGKANRIAMTTAEDARLKAARAHDEEQELREKIAVYEAMVNRGIIGQEHRLDWIETIRKIKTTRKLIDVRYEIGPQQPIKAEIVSSSLSGFDIMSSPMKLDMLLLHENDLLNFLADLRSDVQGYVRARECDVSRVATDTTVKHGPVPQLQASCELDWVTLREKQ